MTVPAFAAAAAAAAEVSFPFQKNVGVFLVSFGVGWGVRGLPLIYLRRGVVIVGSLCVWVGVVSVRGAEPATHCLGVAGTFLSRVFSRVRSLVSALASAIAA